MNPHRRLVTLSANLVRVSREFGEAMVAFYASPEGKASASRSVSGDWGAESDPDRQGQGKAGEYAVAQLFDLDLKTAVKRTTGRADGGSDLRLRALALADVKTTAARKRWLLWSKELNDYYWDKRFDVLVAVSIDEDDWSSCWIEGWINKQEFFDRKLIADGVNDQGKLTPGTWFMEKSDLHDIGVLLRESRMNFVGHDSAGRFVHYCRCGEFGPYGYGFFPKDNKLGTWYCKEHKPK